MPINTNNFEAYQGVIEKAGDPQSSPVLNFQNFSNTSEIPSSGDLGVGVAQVGGNLLVSDGATYKRLGDTGNNLLFLGDSITELNISASTKLIKLNGFVSNADMLTGGKFNIIGVLATGGFKAVDMISTYQSTIAASGADYICILAGTNTDYAYDIAGRITEIESVWQMAERYGIKVIAGTIPIDSSSNNRRNSVNYQLNDYIRQQASTGRIYLWEVANTVVDLTSTAWRSGFSGDGKHPNDVGLAAMARSLANTLNAISVPAHTIESRNFIDPYLITGNPSMYGNNASGANGFVAGTGVTGTGPHGWSLQTGNALLTVASSVAANPDTLEESNELSLDCSFGVANSYLELWKLMDVKTAWAANQAKKLGDFVVPGNGFVYKCITLAGGNTHASTQPTWPTTIGDFVVDSGVTWLCMKQLVPGDILQASVDVKITSLAGGTIGVSHYFMQDDATQTGTGRPQILNVGVAGGGGTASLTTPSNLSNAKYWPIVPSGYTTLKSQKFVINYGANTNVGWLRQHVRIFGELGVTCNVKIKNAELRIVGAM